MASNNIARLGVVLGLDTAEFTASIDKAINENKKLGQAIKRDTNAAANEIIALKYATDDYGKTLTKVQMIEREISQGKFRMATDDVKQKLLAQAAAYDAITMSSKKAATGLSQFEKQNLMYQTTDFVTQVASGQNALIAFMQQGGQLKDVMGGVKETLVKLAPIVFSVAGGIVAMGTAAGVLAYGLYKGHEELKELNRQLLLTNNYVGMTDNSFKSMAINLSSSKGFSIQGVSDVMLEIVKSSQFTSKNIEAVSTAILTFAKVSGIAATDAAKQLIPMFDGTSNGAFELTKRFNFLTLAQYKQIEALERQGKTQEAIRLTAKLYNDNLETQKSKVEELASSWEKLGNFVDKAWKNIKGFLDPKSIDVQIVELTSKIAMLKAQLLELNEPNAPAASVALMAKIKRDIAQAEALQDSLIEKSRASAEEFTRQQELAKQTDQIKNRRGSGGLSEDLSLDKKVNDARRDLRYANLIGMADDETKIIYESARKQEKLYSDYLSTITGKDKEFDAKRTEAYLAEMQKEMVERDQLLEDFRLKQIGKEVDAAQTARFARQKIEDEEQNKRLEKLGEYTNKYYEAETANKANKDKIEAQIKMVGLSEKQVKLAEIEARYQADIAKNTLEAKGDKAVLEQWNKLAKAKKEDEILNVQLGESLKHLQVVNDVVWNNMMDAIDNFVNAGGKSFEDFARNAIKQLLMVEAKKQALSMWDQAGGVSGIVSAGLKIFGFADGGSPPVGVPSIVGERGPEIFVPKTAGTIIPNNMLGGMGGGQTINYNGPYIANMSAIDTQSGAQFLARNKQAVWATYQSANRSIPMSR